ncbi:MAG: hypothetical protein WDO17_13030 [Alphaproteobacteria bacterium]
MQAAEHVDCGRAHAPADQVRLFVPVAVEQHMTLFLQDGGKIARGIECQPGEVSAHQALLRHHRPSLVTAHAPREIGGSV